MNQEELAAQVLAKNGQTSRSVDGDSRSQVTVTLWCFAAKISTVWQFAIGSPWGCSRFARVRSCDGHLGVDRCLAIGPQVGDERPDVTAGLVNWGSPGRPTSRGHSAQHGICAFPWSSPFCIYWPQR